ncbi:hypothetical protein [Nocardia seriolae]|uniref:Tetratricopeptide repeat protein n=1 Tax=Nocardia seriolae TaxID=37332 RepID=A0A0B8N946_9NOCA|nr:hypothetical protein [Nocardia seriolae]APA98313.1 hypothetical protein NS506_04265 [Nocardia seriolae]MTJ62990.1 hypothetical protein [Nocardia seriolae]MTJ73732.1 hypothetical protein [Nocardia seriolae]MTJ88017.1 hypothetical protein [Nocardia seriolae]MTK32007.1 hypothetical protein [Nocardia seriolae]
MTAVDETMNAINDAVVLGRQGNTAAARERLTELWETIGADGDPLHRVSLAHYMADLQDHAADGLTWDIRALDACAALTDERAQAQHSGLSVRGFYPSLHLNLADNYGRLGAFDTARRHLNASRDRLADLSDDGYGLGVRAGIANVEAALADHSTERLPSHP